MVNDIRSLLRDSSMQCERKPIDDFMTFFTVQNFFRIRQCRDRSQKSDDTNEDFRLEGVSALPAFIDSRRKECDDNRTTRRML